MQLLFVWISSTSEESKRMRGASQHSYVDDLVNNFVVKKLNVENIKSGNNLSKTVAKK